MNLGVLFNYINTTVNVIIITNSSDVAWKNIIKCYFLCKINKDNIINYKWRPTIKFFVNVIV